MVTCTTEEYDMKIPEKEAWRIYKECGGDVDHPMGPAEKILLTAIYDAGEIYNGQDLKIAIQCAKVSYEFTRVLIGPIAPPPTSAPIQSA